MYDKIYVLVPTYDPSLKFYKVLDNLKDAGFNNVLIVDDGSEDKAIFKNLKDYKIIKHDKNQGKGRALKTGFDYLSSLDILGVITVDDDLQQDISDIKKVADKFLEDNNVVLGCRTFDKKVPLKRRLSNKFINSLFNLKCKVNISDTQTGLRCFPKKLLKEITNISGDGFEYEMNVLKTLALKDIPISEVSIKTIYSDEISHYKDISDSYKIVKMLLKK